MVNSRTHGSQVAVDDRDDFMPGVNATKSHSTQYEADTDPLNASSEIVGKTSLIPCCWFGTIMMTSFPLFVREMREMSSGNA
jgi:hypothetical protein